MVAAFSDPCALAPHVLWRGAISFCLVHSPVGRHSATQDCVIGPEGLDKRSMDRAGDLCIHMRTGREIAREDVVRGVAQKDGHARVSDAELGQADPPTTQTIAAAKARQAA